MSGARPPDLPDYEKPPVIEVAAGVQFRGVDVKSVDIGLFWERVQASYPKASDNPPLLAELEQAEGIAQSVDFSPIPPLRRTFFESADSEWLLQVQGNRLLHNWRRTSEESIYPRFEECFNRFHGAWDTWVSFCKETKDNLPTVDQLELTYVNHVPSNAGWRTLGEIGSIFPDMSWRSGNRFLPVPESLAWNSVFPLPAGAGRLRVTICNAIRQSDKAHVLLCQLTARGLPSSKDWPSIEAWFLVAREWIVRGFADLVSSEVQGAFWRRLQ